MSFLGPVTRLDGALVRPHDIDVSPRALPPARSPGEVVRLLRVGFETRLTVRPVLGRSAARRTVRSRLPARRTT